MRQIQEVLSRAVVLLGHMQSELTKMKYLRIALAVALLAVTLTGCVSKSGWVRHEVCFGLSMDSGHTQISQDQWQAFLRSEICVRLPSGFTVYDGDGFWMNVGKTYCEKAKVLMVVAPSEGGTQEIINTIIASYKKQFRQESVLQIKTAAQVEFR